MPKFLEDKLKREYGANSKVPYKVMNAIGAMRGNKVTAKGERMQAKHDGKLTKQSSKKRFETESHAYNFKQHRGGRRPNVKS